MCEDFNRLVEQYMLMDKKTLAELLALKELASRVDTPVVPSYPSTPSSPSYPWPWWPWYPTNPGIGDVPWWPQVWYTTSTNGKDLTVDTVKHGGLNRHDTIEDTQSCCNDGCQRGIRAKLDGILN